MSHLKFESALFATDPPRFLARLPHCHYGEMAIAAALLRGGFTGSNIFETVSAQSTADSPRTVAMAYCQGTPLRSEIEARDASILAKATDIVAAAIGQRFGTGKVTAKIQAIVIAATRAN